MTKIERIELNQKIDIPDAVVLLAIKINELVDEHNQTTEPVEECPVMYDRYWFINSKGIIAQAGWTDSAHDNNRKNYTGIFKTQAEAEAAKEKIKEFLKNI